MVVRLTGSLYSGTIVGGSASTQCGAIGARRRPGMGALLVLLVVGLVLSAPAEGKPGGHKCKRSQATVKVRGKKRCKPIRSVFPRPRAGDERIAAWKTALNPGRGLRDRRGRKLLSLKRGHGRAGQRIYTAMVGTMPQGFARLDALALASPRPLLGRASASAAGCGSTAPTRTDGFSNNVNGTRVDASLRTAGDSKTQVFSSKVGDLFLRTSIEEGTCSPLRIPRCPTASGAVDSKGAWVRRLQIKVLYFKDAELVSQLVVTETRTTRTSGQTAADAKLDHLDIDDSLAVSIFSTSQGTEGGVRESFRLKRAVRVNMRSRPESYSPGNAAFESFDGASPRLADWDDRSFAGVVGSLIFSYRIAESEAIGGGFANTPGMCAELKFSPASDTLTLKQGQRGKVNVRVESNGTADNPRATAAKSAINLTSKENANVTPASGKGKVVPFDYTVTNAGSGITVRAGFRATSTAGLAAPANWTQPTKGGEPPVKRITGTFTGSWEHNGARISWTGSVTLTRPNPGDPGAQGGYVQSGGTVTYTASGLDPLYQVCAVSHTEQFSLPDNPGRGIATVNGTPPDFGAPYHYMFDVVPSNTDFMRLTLSGCSSGNEGLNGTTQDVYFGSPMEPLLTGSSIQDQTSPDGIVYDGQKTLRDSQWSWTLRGKTS